MMANAGTANAMSASDERAIRAVLIRYATGIDTRDWLLFRSCFTEDFEGDYGSFGKWRGPREITDYMRAAHLALGPTLHRMTNCVIHCECGQISARSYVDALLTPGAAGGAVHRGIGIYDDRFADGGRLADRAANLHAAAAEVTHRWRRRPDTKGESDA